MHIPRHLGVFVLSGLLLILWMLHVKVGVFQRTATQDPDQYSPASDSTKSEQTPPPSKGGLAPCGEACSYSGRPVPDPNNPHYPQLEKDFDCPSLLARMAYTDHEIVHPPPEQPPADLLDEFTQHGDMPLRYPWYRISFSPDRKSSTKVFNRSHVENLIHSAEKGGNVNVYRDGGCLVETLRAHREKFTNQNGTVVGTQRPWLEAMLLAFGAEHITTLEYNPMVIEHPKVEVYTPYTFAAGSHDKFDFGVSFSSIEHSGLGRYGDPINPYGDLEAMAQMWCLTKPNGYFFLGIPCSDDDSSYLKWNVNRVYGSKRLQYLTANWKLEESVRCKGAHIVLVLQRRG